MQCDSGTWCIQGWGSLHLMALPLLGPSWASLASTGPPWDAWGPGLEVSDITSTPCPLAGSQSHEPTCPWGRLVRTGLAVHTPRQTPAVGGHRAPRSLPYLYNKPFPEAQRESNLPSTTHSVRDLDTGLPGSNTCSDWPVFPAQAVQQNHGGFFLFFFSF